MGSSPRAGHGSDSWRVPHRSAASSQAGRPAKRLRRPRHSGPGRSRRARASRRRHAHERLTEERGASPRRDRRTGRPVQKTSIRPLRASARSAASRHPGVLRGSRRRSRARMSAAGARPPRRAERGGRPRRRGRGRLSARARRASRRPRRPRSSPIAELRPADQPYPPPLLDLADEREAAGAPDSSRLLPHLAHERLGTSSPSSTTPPGSAQNSPSGGPCSTRTTASCRRMTAAATCRTGRSRLSSPPTPRGSRGRRTRTR